MTQQDDLAVDGAVLNDAAPAETAMSTVDVEAVEGEQAEEAPKFDPENIEIDPEDIEEEPIPAPQWWSAEDKEKWEAALKAAPPELKETLQVVQRREMERDAHINKLEAKTKHAEKDAFERASGEYVSQLAQNAWLLEQMFPAPEVEQPDIRLLNGDIEQQAYYHRQKAHNDQILAQHSGMQQRIMAMRAEAQRVIEAQEGQGRQAEYEAILEAFPVLSDGNSDAAKALLSNMQETALALGYPPEILSEANADDMKAINTAAKWKAGYDKWQAAQNKAKMSHARSFKKAPGAVPGGQTVANAQPNNEIDRLKASYPTTFGRN